MVIAHYYRVDGGKTTRHGFLKRRDVMDQREFARELMDEAGQLLLRRAVE